MIRNKRLVMPELKWRNNARHCLLARLVDEDAGGLQATIQGLALIPVTVTQSP